MKNFLWSSSLEGTRNNLVKWEIVCLPKQEGGAWASEVKGVRLCSLSPFLQQGNKWKEGNGLYISLWYVHWIDQLSISSIFPSIRFSPRDRIIDIIQENSWNFPSNLPVNLKDFLLLSTGGIFISDSSPTLSHGHPFLEELLFLYPLPKRKPGIS